MLVGLPLSRRRLRARRQAEHQHEDDPSHHFFGRAKAMISSFVTSEHVSPPPLLTTTTNCRPSLPMYVMGVVSIEDGILISHNLSPVAVANARNLKSSVPPTKVRP